MGVIIPILSKFDDKGIKQAKGAFGGLKSNVSGLKRMLAGGLAFVGLNASVRGLIDAGKAAAADIKSQELLRANLERTTKARANAMIAAEAFIQKLSNEVGVVDDELRPSLAALAATTGNVTKAQRYLSATLDLSAKSGFSQSKVQTAISRAYFGNMMSLKKMFPEVNRVTQAYEKQNGKAKTVKEKTDAARYAIEWLAKRYKGIAAQQATPFDKMNTAMDNLKEALGRVVLPELTRFVTYLTDKVVPKVEQMFDALANPKTDVGAAFANLKTDIGKLATAFGNFFKVFSKDGKSGVVGFINFVDTLVKNAPTILAVMASFKALKILTAPVAGSSLLAMLGKFAPLVGTILALLGLRGDTQQKPERKITPKPKPTVPTPLKPGTTPIPKAPTGFFGISNMQGGVTINISGVVGDKVAVGKAVAEALKAYQKKNGTYTPRATGIIA